MSLNVIIIAVIAIIVLVVIIVIFSGKTKIFSTTTSSCEAKGGECIVPPLDVTNPDAPATCPSGYAKMFGAKCGEDEVCCSRMEG